MKSVIFRKVGPLDECYTNSKGLKSVRRNFDNRIPGLMKSNPDVAVDTCRGPLNRELCLRNAVMRTVEALVPFRRRTNAAR